MEVKKSIIIAIIAAVLLTILIAVGGYFLFFGGANLSIELSNFDKENEKFFRVNRSDSALVLKATRNIRNFLEPYKNDSNPNVYPNCNFFNPPPSNKTCGVDINAFSPCTNVYGFGLRQGSPCVFMKIKSKYDFKPQFYNESNLPEEMPEDLKTDIRYYVRNNQAYAQIVWVSCDGKSDEDKKNLGAVTYLPRRGYPGYYFNCKDKNLCTQPIIALRFERPALGVKINVRCKAWAENIDEEIDFQLLVD